MEIPSPSNRQRQSGFVHLRSITADPPHNLIRLKSDRLYTVGRDSRRCDIVLNDGRISRRHCQIFLDSSDRRLRLVDGFSLPRTSSLSEIRRRLRAGCDSRCSLNGVFVNGRRLERGVVAELGFGDEILFGCSGPELGCEVRCGFVVERIVFSCMRYDAHKLFDVKQTRVGQYFGVLRLKDEELDTRATSLLSECRRIMETEDPVTYLRSSLDLASGKGIVEHIGSAAEKADEDSESCIYAEHDSGILHRENDTGAGCYSDGKTFFLNRLEFMAPGTDNRDGVTLPELFQPVDSLTRVFVATFTYDISWFLSCCRLPCHLPITVVCHNAERCWSDRQDSRTSAPYSDYPNLLLVFPPFPEVIAFGKDRKKQGVACHHPKLMVLQRADRIRVVITSANLNSKQWNHVTNTVWWQDFPLRITPDYSALFGTLEVSKSDFAAQLASFIATLISDVPSQAHWITELTKYDFGGAVGHLVASIPGLHAEKSGYYRSNYYMSGRPQQKNVIELRKKVVEFCSFL